MGAIRVIVGITVALGCTMVAAENGSEGWLRYRQIPEPLRSSYAAVLSEVHIEAPAADGPPSVVLQSAASELHSGLSR